MDFLVAQAAKDHCGEMQQGHVLRRLARQGNAELVSQILDAGVAVDAPQDDGCTALWLAAEHGCTDVVRLLLQRQANPNATKTAGNISALFIAAQNGHANVVELLLHHGASPNACKTSGASPLFIASQQCHPEIVRSLLRAGASHSIATANGVTPLMIAAFQGHMQIVRLLLAAGADPYVKGQDKNAIEWAAENHHGDAMQRVVDEHLGNLQSELQRKRAMEEQETPLVAKRMHPALGTPELMSDHRPFDRWSVTGSQVAMERSSGNAMHHTAPSSAVSAATPRSGSQPLFAARQEEGSAARSSRHYNTRSFSEPLPPGVGAMQPLRGGLSADILAEEERRNAAFRSWAKKDALAVRPPPKLDWSTSPAQNNIDRPLYLTEAQWQAHKERLEAQAELAKKDAAELQDSWMYAVSATTAYAQRQAALRREAAELQRASEEKADKARRTVSEAGFAFPRLPKEQMDALRQFLAKGSGAKGPPPPLEPEEEDDVTPVVATSPAVASPVVAAPTSPSSPSRATTLSDRLRERQMRSA